MSPTIDGPFFGPAFTAWIALDMGLFDRSVDLVAKLHPYVAGFKVHASVENDSEAKLTELAQNGAKKLWWDRKAHDTPTTVALVASVAKACDVDRLTVHASGGIEMMMAAVAHGPQEIIAITDLTSLSEPEIGMLSGMLKDASTLQKAHWAKLAGVTHLVCSCQEVGVLNERRKVSAAANQPLELHGMKLIVPGSRSLPSSNVGSQKRSTTASEALSNGADELVLGNEVWGTTDPVSALMAIYETVTR